LGNKAISGDVPSNPPWSHGGPDGGQLKPRKSMIQGAKPGKQTYLGYRQFSGPIDASAVRDGLLRVASGEVQLQQKDGYSILEAMRLLHAHFGNLVAEKKIPAGKKHQIERFIGSQMDAAALAEVAIRYEDMLLTRLYAKGRMLIEHIDEERGELASYAVGRRRVAALTAARWIEVLNNIAKPRGKGGGKAARLLPDSQDVQDWAVCTFAAQMTVIHHPSSEADDPMLFFQELPATVRSAILRGELPSLHADPVKNFDAHFDRIRMKASKWLEAND
jgi:hypothetical protein